MVEQTPRRYPIFYSTQVHKKHKIFDDGYLDLSKTKARVLTAEKNLIFETVRPKNLKDNWSAPFQLGRLFSKVTLQELAEPCLVELNPSPIDEVNTATITPIKTAPLKRIVVTPTMRPTSTSTPPSETEIQHPGSVEKLTPKAELVDKSTEYQDPTTEKRSVEKVRKGLGDLQELKAFKRQKSEVQDFSSMFNF
jgi:hypothetical protein